MDSEGKFWFSMFTMLAMAVLFLLGHVRKAEVGTLNKKMAKMNRQSHKYA